MDREKVDELIEKGEGQTIEFKRSDILGKKASRLAKEMTAFANADGGYLLIGVEDDGGIEEMSAKKGHEEHIMNIASNNCDPPLNPTFETVNYSDEADIYVIEIDEAPEGELHRAGEYFIRRGSTVRRMKHQEIRKRFEQGKSRREISAESDKSKQKIPIESNKLSQKVLMKLYRFAHEKLPSKWQHAIFGGLTTGGSIAIILSSISLTSDYTMIPQDSIALVIFIGAILTAFGLLFYLIRGEAKCEKCGQYYGLEKEESYQVDKEKRIDEPDRIKVEDIYKCANCGNTITKSDWKKKQSQR